MNGQNYTIIMAGGTGTRLWPVSRQRFPKQFHDVLGIGRTLLQLTYDRVLKFCDPSNIFIVTNKDYTNLIKEQLPDLSEHQILPEPDLKNTAPCIAYAVYKIEQQDPEANLLITPADQLIIDTENFSQLCQYALKTVSQHDILLTFGIEPTRPDTGFGYIEYGKDFEQSAEHPIKAVKAFKEKPDLDTAKVFLQSGNFAWNSGMFAWNIKTIRKSFEQFLPEIAQYFEQGKNIYFTDQEEAFLQDIYLQCPKISIDYGIMEKARNVYVIPANFGWTDLGTWKSVDEQKDKDDHGNCIQGEVITYDTENTFVKISPDKLAVIQGLDNYIVVENDGILMICSKDQEQQIKQFLEDLKTKGYHNYI